MYRCASVFSEEEEHAFVAWKWDESKKNWQGEKNLFKRKRRFLQLSSHIYTRTRAHGKFTDESRREPFPLREINAS